MGLMGGTLKFLKRFVRLRWWWLRQQTTHFEATMFTRTRYSQSKMKAMSVAGGFSQVGYYVIWKDVFPQPYENLTLRLVGSLMFALLALQRWWPRRLKPLLPSYWYLVLTYNLPFFVGYMVLRNDGSPIWLMTHIASLYLTMMLFDLVSFCVIFGVGTLAALAVYVLGPHGPLPMEHLWPYLPLLMFAAVTGPLASIWQEIAEQSRVDALTGASNNIAHELRTPLGSLRIAGQAMRRFLPDLLRSHQLALDAGLPVPEMRSTHIQALHRSMDVIEHEVTHANTVIDMLLMAARPIGNVRLEPIHARHCVEQALFRYPYASRDERNRVQFSQADDFVLLGSETLLVHVIFNLLRNALFHTGRAGRGVITLAIANTPTEHLIRVHDTGPGIPPDVLPRIFNRFYSFTDQAKGGHSGGLGIGLAFSQAAVRSMGGSLRCRSTWGEFTEFEVAFPVADGQEADA